ncbi:MAG: Na+/H+ antiporter NhaC family protein [Rubritalea sp.]|uniref:Na+/H+ antiporter NhaC family protein n=1 Tax=Rubritalea sp. TaxID=2109375 RepID=UPI0032422DD1
MMTDGVWVLLPAVVALVTIVWTRKAAISLLAAMMVGVLMLHGGNPLESSKALFVDYLFPALSGPWHMGPIVFTLVLGSFSQVLERSGGFSAMLGKWLDRPSSVGVQRRSLLSVYGLGLLCFFDGLANAILVGRVARPVTDRLKVSRQLLAYIVDSTSSAVACIAFISTWIATQLSLIQEGIKGSGVDVGAVELYFHSIPANPYCWMVLWLLLLVIWRSWWIGPMKNYQAEGQSLEPEATGSQSDQGASTSSVVIPLVSILLIVPSMIYLWQDGADWSWNNAFSSSSVPQAMVAAGFISLFVACVCFPKSRKSELSKHLADGAAGMLPALVILVLAWALGSVFKDLQVAQLITRLLGGQLSLMWLPFGVFLVGALTSFLTGSSWGTMGILMPLVLPVGIEMGAGLAAEELVVVLPTLIGSVFGGAVFGDNCSPFSDTTILTSLATGCSPSSHVSTQLPYALIAAVAAAISYALVAVGLPAWTATLMLAAVLAAAAFLMTKR